MKRDFNMEKIVWRQMAKLELGKEEDGNTRMFHKLVNGRKKRNVIERLGLGDGTIIKDDGRIEEKLIVFSKILFKRKWFKAEFGGFGLEAYNAVNKKGGFRVLPLYQHFWGS
ncbi:Hypothetical predicted protein [Prunus dulcis]|uniref:Uncharacterized protein n=1 Tax=Prunus dulcis TaxID=3755 RepID=A0A5E4G5N5_PRUDU|nr:hypothetical protein L3X38_026019 [Prunus dulcis]VVA34948.1 Hypothetical predicted protein [Prunus dulcis]